jgi:hypothetical protein
VDGAETDLRPAGDEIGGVALQRAVPQPVPLIVDQSDPLARRPQRAAAGIQDDGDDVLHGQRAGQRRDEPLGILRTFRGAACPTGGRRAGRLCRPGVGDVGERTDELGRGRVRAHRYRPAGHHPLPAVDRDDPELRVEGLPPFDTAPPRAADRVPVVRVNGRQPTGAGQLRPALPGRRPPPRHVRVQRPVGVRVEDVHRRRVDEGAVARLRPGQLVLGGLPGGHVDGDEHGAHRGPVRVRGRVPARLPDLGRLGPAGRDAHLEVRDRLPGPQHSDQQPLQLMADVTEQLRHGAADVLQRRTAVEPGERLVDPDVPAEAVVEGQSERCPVEERLEQRGRRRAAARPAR